MMGEHVVFQAGTATEAGYLALPEGGVGPGILVLHAWWGLTPFFCEVCERLAGEGFGAFAPDLNAGQTAATIEEATVLMQARDGERTEAAAFGGLAYLREHPAVQNLPLGVLGCSMGGAWALVLSAAFPQQVAAAVILYGSQPVDFAAARAAYLGHFAEHDAWEPLEDIRLMEADMRAAGREVTFYTYEHVEHWFFERDRPQYNPAAAEVVWERTLLFLRQQLAG